MDACIYCAVIHAYGLIGIEQDVTKALRYFQQALGMVPPLQVSATMCLCIKVESSHWGYGCLCL